MQNEIMKDVLARCPTVAVAASEEEDEALELRGPNTPGAYVVVFDPLDGSRNIDASIPTGRSSEAWIYGFLFIFWSARHSSLQQAKYKVASGARNPCNMLACTFLAATPRL